MAKNFFEDHIHTDSLGHLYFIQDSIGVPELLSYIQETFNIDHVGNPDVSIETYETFTIAHSRSLKERQAQKAVQGGKRIFILSLLTFGREAEQALLKVFEEPSENVHIFIYLPEPEKLPDTIKSRGQSILKIPDTVSKEVQDFIDSPIKERLTYIQKKIASYEETDTSAPLRSFAVSFVKELEIALHQSGSRNIHIYTVLEEARDYLHDRSASVKMLLEHIALIYTQKDVL